MKRLIAIVVAVVLLLTMAMPVAANQGRGFGTAEDTASTAEDVTVVGPMDLTGWYGEGHETVYFYRVVTKDPDGNVFKSTDMARAVWFESGNKRAGRYDVTGDGADALYLFSPQGGQPSIHQGKVTVFYDNEGDGNWWKITAQFDRDGSLLSINGDPYSP